jgi:hypothetical protein
MPKCPTSISHTLHRIGQAQVRLITDIAAVLDAASLWVFCSGHHAKPGLAVAMVSAKGRD